MILTIDAISDASVLDALQTKVEALQWRDGKATAGKVAGAVKDNEQAIMSDAAGQALQKAVMPYIKDNRVVQAAARPRRFTNLLVSKTAGGGHYGAHVDNALMGGGTSWLRTDISFTLFLTPPEDYDGGELVVNNAGMNMRIKAKAGQLVLYPSTSIHEVTPVTKGERVVIVGWIESIVADPSQRELLFDMENLRVSLRQKLPAQSVELLTLDKSIANLVRMWGAV